MLFSWEIGAKFFPFSCIHAFAFLVEREGIRKESPHTRIRKDLDCVLRNTAYMPMLLTVFIEKLHLDSRDNVTHVEKTVPMHYIIISGSCTHDRELCFTTLWSMIILWCCSWLPGCYCNYYCQYDNLLLSAVILRGCVRERLRYMDFGRLLLFWFHKFFWTFMLITNYVIMFERTMCNWK